MTDGSLPSSRVLRYDQIVSGGTNQEEQLFSGQRVWREQTRYIRKDLLKDIRGISSGDKIVPGCYDPEDEIKKNNDKTITVSTEKDNDGKSMAYPPIPVVDPRLSLVKHKHHGTNRFLSRLEPRERTRLFLTSSSAAAATASECDSGAPNFVWLDRVLKDCYRGSWKALLGDLQLSYVLFLYLGCYSSLAHWKDLLAMVSLAVDGIGGDPNRVRSRHRHESLYRSLLRLLPYQLSSMNDPEFLENIDEGGGNFLIPSLARLKGYYENERQPPESNTTTIQDPEEEEEPELLSKFRHVLSSKFPQTFVFRPSVPTITRIQSNSDDSDKGNNNNNDNGSTGDTANHTMDVDWGDEDEEDGPVVVSSEEIEASMARSSVAATTRDDAITKELRTKYPLLVAAMTSSEDVLMTCARALDEKSDVSLVREAAAYLEDMVEEQPRGIY
jgi:A1 cistron-splicing factor AAR2